MTDATTPTVYEWAGGMPAFERLTEAFYKRVRADDLLASMFAHMPPDHPKHVAIWLAAKIGAPRLILVKSVDVVTQHVDSLVAAGIVDNGSIAMSERFAGRIHVVGPSADTAFAGLLAPAAEHAA